MRFQRELKLIEKFIFHKQLKVDDNNKDSKQIFSPKI